MWAWGAHQAASLVELKHRDGDVQVAAGGHHEEQPLAAVLFFLDAEVRRDDVVACMLKLGHQST